MTDTRPQEDGSRGTKRTADEAQLTGGGLPRSIKALDQDVVNKIAAGEIIVAPVHALKELLENAVDAGSTSIEVVIKEGGLKLIQITDNGHGINRDDLPILCERFTTSKLKAFEDLTSIGTYGFRGEALASISHIAHLTVTTKTKTSNCAWRAHYADGKLVSAKPGQSPDPKPTAGRGGTQLTIEDLFYNVPTRRRAFRSASEEYAKILDMVGRYAVHCTNVAFSCKKQGESSMGISVPSNAKTVDRIRQIHGSSIANELLEIDIASVGLGFTAQGFVTNANFHVKRTVMLLFINHRAVESSAIKKAVEQCYATFLPKGGHPFIYLALDIDPQRVDVNVHPTKREVNFLNEDEIIDLICETIRAKLTTVDTSRTFMTQSLLPGARIPLAPDPGERRTNTITTAASSSPAAVSTRKPYENNLVRTDSKMRKITSMLPPGSHPSSSNAPPHAEPVYEYTDKEPTLCRLTTVKQLRASVRDAMHSGLTEMFSTHTFVGVVDEQKRIVAIQGGVKLYLVDYGMICHDLFYQTALTAFSNLGSIQLNPPLSLPALLSLALAHNPSSSPPSPDVSTQSQTLTTKLLTHAAMLSQYFSLSLSPPGVVTGIPLLLKSYTPPLGKLPAFLLRVATEVDFKDEKKCFEGVSRELSAFYVPERLAPMREVDGEENEESGEVGKRREEISWLLEHVMFPAVRQRLVATRELLEKGAVVEVANLRGLYRVFERC